MEGKPLDTGGEVNEAGGNRIEGGRQRLNSIAGMGENKKARGGKGLNESFSRRDPVKSSASGGIVVHVSFVDAYMTDLMNMEIPRIHGDTKEQDTKGATHVNAVMNRERTKSGTYFVQYFAAKEDMTAITYNPVRYSAAPGMKGPGEAGTKAVLGRPRGL